MNAKRSTSCSVAVVALLMIVQGCSDEISNPSPIDPAFAPGPSVNVNLDQCANSPRTSPCTWQNGDLNKNNSTYAEGLVVPFRLAIEGLTPGQHTIQVNYDFTAGGHKAYDFLASVNATELVNVCAAGGGGRSSLCGASNAGMPAAVSLATANFVADNFAVDGLNVQNAQAAFTNDLTRRQLRAYGASAVSIGSVTHAGSTDANSTGNITVTFTVPAGGSAVALVWGGHLADSDFWNGNNPPDGAGEVSGAPWHMRTQQLDNSGNKNQDRSIQPSAIIEPPNLTITKTADAATVAAGDPIGFTITVTNTGAGAATNVDIDDTLPAGLTWTESPDKTECAITGGNILHCDIASLASGASFSVHVTATSTTANCPGVTNTATTRADNNDLVTSNEAAIVIDCPVLDIEKTTDTPTVDAGQTARFTLTVTNNGPGSATNVDIDDTLPSGHTWTENPATTECAITGGNVLHCDIASLAAGAQFAVTVETTATTSDCNGITNPLATADADNAGQVSDGPVTVNVNCPVLSVVKSTSTPTVDAGQTAKFTITVTNDGPGTAVNVDLDDTLPSGLTWTENPDQTDCSIASGNVLHCDIASLTDGAAFSVTVEALTDTDDCPGITNVKATAVADNADEAESQSETVNVNCPVLSVEKAAASGTVSGGEDVEYTVTVTNDGPGTAVNVDLDDTLPAGFTWTENPDETECDITGGTVLHCDVGDLADGASFSVTVKAPTTGDDCGTIKNTATAEADNADQASSLEVSIDIECPNLTIDKTPDGGTAAVGDMATFTVQVSNSGPGKAFDTAIVDTLPADLTWSEDPDLTECSIATVIINMVSRQILTCNVGTLNAGGSFSVTVKSNAIPSSFLLPAGGGTPVVPLEIDGNLADGPAAGIDWVNSGIVCATSDGCDIDLPTGATDNSFGQGTKEDTEVPTIVAGSIPNNKSDLLRFYVTSRKQTVGADVHDFLYLAWERVQAPNGTTNMDFELNQSSQLSANGVTPVRMAGDILVKYDLARGGASLALGYHVWVTAASAGGLTAAQACEATNSFPCWGKVKALNPPAVAGAANSAAVVDDIPPGNPRTLDPLTFGEAGIDLQAAGIFQTGVCRNFGQAYLKSRSSDSFNSEIKDFIAPIPINITNCQPRTIDNTAWASASNFTPSGGQPGDGISDDGDITVTENGSALLGAPSNIRLGQVDEGGVAASNPAEASSDLRVQSAVSAERAESPWALQRLHEASGPDGAETSTAPAIVRIM